MNELVLDYPCYPAYGTDVEKRVPNVGLKLYAKGLNHCNGSGDDGGDEYTGANELVEHDYSPFGRGDYGGENVRSPVAKGEDRYPSDVIG